MKIDLTLRPPENCLHFETCQFNDCPLEPKPNYYEILPEDKLLYGFHKCRCSKIVRMKIAHAFSMKSLGLTLRELSNMTKSMKMKEQYFFQRDKNLKIENSGVLGQVSGVKNDFQ